MQILFKVILSTGTSSSGLCGFGASARRSGSNPATHATVSYSEGPPPNPANVPFVLPKDIRWTAATLPVFTADRRSVSGDQSKEGPYGVLIKWARQGRSPDPIFFTIRRAGSHVVSGTWWVSSSNVYDEKTTYPFHAGTFSTDVANTVHWDGARSGKREPAIIPLTGVGPVKTVQVDESGKPLPARGRGNE